MRIEDLNVGDRVQFRWRTTDPWMNCTVVRVGAPPEAFDQTRRGSVDILPDGDDPEVPISYCVQATIDRGSLRRPTQLLPSHVHSPEDERIFVFGSNLLGIHGAGAAWYALDELEAEWGVGEGPTGRTYALPTCYRPGEPVTMEELDFYVQRFLCHAKENPDLRFFVSAVGCGLAGFTEEEVAPLFKNAPDNCDLPPGWRS